MKINETSGNHTSASTNITNHKDEGFLVECPTNPEMAGTKN